MNRLVLLGALAWMLVITVAHVSLNIGWSNLKDDRNVMRVGFLPVT